MRVLFVSPRYYPHIGGVEYVVKSVAERLVKRGHDVTVLCGDDKTVEPFEEDVNGVRVVRWPTWSPGNAYHIPKMRGKLAEKLRELAKGCDVAHFHSVHSVLTMYALDTLKNTCVHRVLTPYYHGTGHTLIRRILWTGWRFYVKKLVKHVDAVHTVSKFEAKLVEQDFRVRAIPIENGVEEWVLNVDWKPSNYVMYSGRIEKYKNVHRLANIVEILNSEYGLDLELRVYGTGPYVDKLRKHLEKLRIKSMVNPPQPFEKYIETLSRATLFGLISQRESYPQSVNEANAIGVPVVVAKPWGEGFGDRTRTLVVDLRESDKEIAEKVTQFLVKVGDQPRANVPSWNKVVFLYVQVLYST